MGFANGRILGGPLRLIASGGRLRGLLIADRRYWVKKIPNLSLRESRKRAKQKKYDGPTKHTKGTKQIPAETDSDYR